MILGKRSDNGKWQVIHASSVEVVGPEAVWVEMIEVDEASNVHHYKLIPARWERDS